jgi:hypothetical protein
MSRAGTRLILSLMDVLVGASDAKAFSTGQVVAGTW